jgi:predicted enzyme related to lactoylglutathione lyase
MSEVTRYEPGSFCWAELATDDAQKAKQFYGALFEWHALDRPVGAEMTYTILQLGGKDVGALYRRDRSKSPGPPSWLSYISVKSADECARKAKALEGTVLSEPFDVQDAGRMAVLQDPTGAGFGLWEPKRDIGAKIVNEPGALCWNELQTDDTASASRFYTSLFGWTTKTDSGALPYTEFFRGTTAVAGMLPTPAQRESTAPHWLVYFAVEGCEEKAGLAKSLGGSLKVPPTEIPNVGRFSVIQDPQGAVFAIIRLDAPAA